MKKNKLFFSKLVAIFLITLFLFSCKNETDTTTELQNSHFVFESVYPNIKGENIEIEYLGNKITVKSAGDYYIFLGDIRLKKNDIDSAAKKSKLQKAAAVSNRKWANNKVFYRIQSGFPNPQRIADAIQIIQNNTDLVFEYSTTSSNYIEIVNSANGTYSDWIGYKGGRQEIGISGNSTYGNVIHELCHALGLFHEQCRKDRDNSIIVNFNNISPDWRSQYYTYTISGYSGFDIASFDFGSIMLYPSDNAYNGSWSMTDLAGNPFSAQRASLSSGDIVALNFLYPCAIIINGPGSGYNGFTYTYSANPSGNGLVRPFIYNWEISEMGAENWQYLSNSQSVSIDLYDYLSFDLKVTVTTANGVVLESQKMISNKGDKY